MAVTNEPTLNRFHDLELSLELLSFAGGENTISEDHVCKADEARVCQNWDSVSLGGMRRSKGFNEVADGSTTYSRASDLLIQHEDTTGNAVYGVIEGDLVIQNASAIEQEDASAFTSGVLCHGVSAGAKLFITNATDNLKVKTIGNPIAAVTDVPTQAYNRIYNHKNRLIIEGGATTKNRVQGSRTGVGYWNSADTWTLANDAWSIDLPDETFGCAPDFPSGNEVLVFTERNCYSIYNFPNTAFRPLGASSRGCSAPLSVAKGDEGVYFVSKYPTLGVFVFDGSSFNELTSLNHDVFVDKIDFDQRIFGTYANRKYYLFYTEKNSGDAFPNRLRIYDAQFKRWMERPVNPDLDDNFGYPALLTFTDNNLYVASSQKDKWYELETEDESDEGTETQAVYTTKNFSSRDFAVASGGQFPIDDVRLKLTKMTITYNGTAGSISFYWGADRGLHSGSRTIDLTSAGDALLNESFIVNTSSVVASPPDKTRTFSFPNSAVGRRFYFTFSNSSTSSRPTIKKVKFSAVAIGEQ
jgi:hypothetical protein